MWQRVLLLTMGVPPSTYPPAVTTCCRLLRAEHPMKTRQPSLSDARCRYAGLLYTVKSKPAVLPVSAVLNPDQTAYFPNSSCFEAGCSTLAATSTSLESRRKQGSRLLIEGNNTTTTGATYRLANIAAAPYTAAAKGERGYHVSIAVAWRHMREPQLHKFWRAATDLRLPRPGRRQFCLCN